MTHCFVFVLGLNLAACLIPAVGQAPTRSLKEVNEPQSPPANQVVAIVGARLVDGRGGPPVAESVVVIRGAKIAAVGARSNTPVPADATVIDGKGMTLLPGLIDSHFHIERDYELPRLYLSHGVTAVRDPGQWNHIYDPVRNSPLPQPRFFLCGPHLDQQPVAYPLDSFVVNTPEDTRAAVNRFVDDGASGIKVYFRLPESLVKVTCEAAHARGVPVTSHLELLPADRAIRAGIDGVEHVTSFGTSLADPADAARFRAAVDADNSARRDGRYDLWSRIDLDHSPRVKPMIDLILKRHIFLSPTLAVFEVRAGDRNATEAKVRGYENMLQFIRLCHKAGATLVVGSHSEVPHAERGRAYQREMELLVECGLTPLEVLTAATLNQARFFHADARIGSIERGKLADLVLVEGDPTRDIGAMRNVRRVMLNGRWVVE